MSGISQQIHSHQTLMACELYYRDDLSQGEVAEQLGISRAKVSRMLKSARSKGWIQIAISPPRLVDLESQIAELLQGSTIRTVRVAGSGKRLLGEAAARHFESLFTQDQTIVLDGGWTVAAFVDALLPNRTAKLTLCPIAADPPSYEVSAYEHMWSMGQKFPNVCRLRPPHFAGCSNLTSEVAEGAKEANFVVLGLGPWRHGFTAVEFTGHLGLDPKNVIRQHPDVVAVCGYCAMAEDGKHVPIPSVDDRMRRALSFAQLTGMASDRDRHVMVLAAGEEKLEPLVAVIKAQFCNTLVIDVELAESFLTLLQREQESVLPKVASG